MRLNDTIIERLWSLIEPVCSDAGYELVDMVLTQSQTGWVLRVFIDHERDAADESPAAVGVVDRSSITFDDCEAVSRELSAVLDVEDPLDHKYNLEVSSPGLDRPLRTLVHFRRHLGYVAKVTLRDGIDGRRNFKGTLKALEPSAPAGDTKTPSAAPSEQPDMAVTIEVDGTEYRLPFNDIKNARLVPDWNALFRQGQPAAKAR